MSWEEEKEREREMLVSRWIPSQVSSDEGTYIDRKVFKGFI